MRSVTLVLAGVSLSDANIQQLRGSHTQDFSKLGGAMQPAVAAHTLSKVENEWRSQALLFAECKANGLSDCGRAQNIFQKSCSTVVSAVVAASSGDVDTVKEYMGVVCAEPELKGWKQDRCQNFAKAISQTMTADNYANREYLNTQGLCLNFWSAMSTEEGARAAQERAQEAKRIEAEHALVAKRAKEAAEALAAAKKAKMEAEAKRQAEEQHRRQAAEKAAQEAKVAAEKKAAAERKAAAEAQAAQAKKAAEKDAKKVVQKKQQHAAVKQQQHAAHKVAPHAQKTVPAAKKIQATKKVVHTVPPVKVASHPVKMEKAPQPHTVAASKKAETNKK